MTQVFPITAGLRAPDWAEGLVVGDQPTVNKIFASRSESRLRLSSVQSGAEFQASWAPLLYPALSELLAFWQLVGTHEDFTLPASFFATGCPVDRATLYRNASPTGRWRFKQAPTLNEIELRVQQCIITLVACID